MLQHILSSWSTAAMPAGPPLMMATFLLVRTSGGRGIIQPFLKACAEKPHTVSAVHCDLSQTRVAMPPAGTMLWNCDVRPEMQGNWRHQAQ